MSALLPDAVQDAAVDTMQGLRRQLRGMPRGSDWRLSIVARNTRASDGSHDVVVTEDTRGPLVEAIVRRLPLPATPAKEGR